MAVALVSSSTVLTASVASSVSGSVTVGTGSNLVAIARLACGNTLLTYGQGTATLGGVSMTACGTADTNALGAVMAWYLVNPPTGSQTLTCNITGGSTGSLYADLTTFSGADQTTPVTGYQRLNSAASSSTLTLSLASATGNMTTSVAADSSGGNTMSSTNQTQINIDNTGSICFGSDQANGAATVTDTWTISGASTSRLMVGFTIQVPIGPTINTQPTSQSCYEGQTATFTISATASAGSLSYQWKDDGSNVGTNSNSYTTAAATYADNGAQITCEVTDSNGTTVSNPATWTVRMAAKPFYLRA